MSKKKTRVLKAKAVLPKTIKAFEEGVVRLKAADDKSALNAFLDWITERLAFVNEHVGVLDAELSEEIREVNDQMVEEILGCKWTSTEKD